MTDILLDCSNLETTLYSLTNILNISENVIIKELNDLDLDEMYEKFPQNDSFEYAIFSWLKLKHRINNDYDGTYYFHATRIFKTQNFKNGIIPLNAAIDYIWSQLYKLTDGVITPENWNTFRGKMTSNNFSNHYTDLYSMKIADKFHHGPYGFLIREVIFSPEHYGNWDYLGAPEIVYDICITFHENYSLELIDKYYHNSEPCIVKFKSSEKSKYSLGIALAYIYCKSNNIEIWGNCSTAYDGEGIKTRPKDIIEIEKVLNWVSKN